MSTTPSETSVVDQYAAALLGLRLAPATIARYLDVARHFVAWSVARRPRADPALACTYRDVAVFLRDHLTDCRCPSAGSRTVITCRAALRHLLRALKQPLTAERLHTAVDDEIQAYDAYLRDVCGAAAHTRVHRTRHVQAFLTSVFGEGPVCVETLRPTCFAAFLITRARTCRPGTVGVIADGLRSYVRYLRLAGRATPGLGEAIPTAARWRLASLPVHLTPPEVDRFLRGFHQRTSRNRRDYAMALCLVHLGLRAAEVANLRLPDVDWHAGSLTIRATKTHRARNLPLVLPVGRALVRYLRARPATTCDHVFVRIGARAGDPLVPSVVRSAARQGYHRAGLPAHYTGTHRLRHTAATRLIAAGASIKDVADVLGHVSIDSTAIYAKVDLARLRAVALPWTEVAR